MTVSNTTSKNSFIGDGATSAFSYTFRIFAASDLVVTVNDLTTDIPLVLTTDYTVSGVGSASGGLVTLLGAFAPLTSLHTVTIERVLPLTQLTDLRNQGSYLPETVEDQFDRVVMMIQQQGGNELINIRLPSSETGTVAKITVPSVADRLSKVFGWDASGDIIAVATVPTSGVTATAYIETLLDDTTAQIARDTLGIADIRTENTIVGDQNDYDPTLDTLFMHSYRRISSGALDLSITGIDLPATPGDPTGYVLTLTNIGTGRITLTHLDVLSATANQFICPFGSPYVIEPNETVNIPYDTTSNKWRIAAPPQSKIFSSTTSAGPGGTGSEATIIGTGIGSLTLPPNFFVPGRGIRIKAKGAVQSTGVAGTLRIRGKLGGVTLLDSTAITMANSIPASTPWSLEADIVCRSVGAAGAMSYVMQALLGQTAGGFGAANAPGVLHDFDTAATLDTRIAQLIDFTAQWGTSDASNVISTSSFEISIIH